MMATRTPLTYSIIQCNLQHSLTATANLRRVLGATNNKTIALIQEPWIRAGRVCGLNNLDGKLLYDNTCSNIRACIYVPRNLQAVPLTEFCFRDLVTARIQSTVDGETVDVTIASAYMPADEAIPSKDVTELVRHCELHNSRLIISADTNAHHPIWGMPQSNSRGEELVNFLFTTNLALANKGAEPTFVTRRCRTIIDLTMVSGNSYDYIRNWRVSDESSCSDHRWIRYELTLDKSTPAPSRNPRRTDNVLFVKSLQQNLGVGIKGLQMKHRTEIDNTVQHITVSLTKSFEDACPLTDRGTNPQGWSQKLERLKRKVRKSFNRAMNTYDDADWDEHKKAQAEYKKCLRRSGRHRWVNFCTNIESNTTANRVRKVCNIMNNALKVVETWCTDFGLSVNPTKTELVLFTNKRNLGTYQLPSLFGTQLQLSDEVKYLGLTMDSKLNWAKHIDNKIKKATISFWQCRKMIGKTWGLSPKITLWLYNSVIRPSLTYGALVWWPKTKQSTTTSKLQKFQRLACVATTGCMRTAPTAALEALLGLAPLHLHVQQEAAAAAHRLWALKLWTQDTRASHTNILNEYANGNPLLLSIYDRIPKKHIHTKTFTIQLHEERSDSSGIHEVRIYTDGSKTKTGTGAGTFSEDLNIRKTAALGLHNSIFQAECVGIIQAANAVLQRQVTEHSIRILSDSAAVLQALNRYEQTSGLIVQCHHLLERVSMSNKVTLQWIKGHSGSRGNDGADILARRGSEIQPTGPEPMIPLPFSQARSWIRQRTAQLHQHHWASTQECRQSKEAFPALNPSYSRKLLNLKRDKLRRVIGIITGHCSLNKHLFTLGVTDSPLCRGCLDAEETAAHVLLECSSVALQRAHYLGAPRTPREACTSVSELLAFLEDIGWLE